MKKLCTFLIVLSPLLNTLAQTNMRKLEDLVNTKDPGWPFVQQMIDSAKNKLEILPCDTSRANDALFKTQVTTRSPMGSVIYKTGGMLVDNGWIRILGSGSKRITRSLPDWNKGKTFNLFGESPSFLLIADDAVGGFFALNGGAFGKDIGLVYYLSPDRLLWEPLDMSYTGFLYFCFSEDLNKFYAGLRWTGWETAVLKLSSNKVFSFYPYLWTTEGKDVNKNKRKQVPVEEQFDFNMQTRKQLGLDKKEKEKQPDQ